MIYGPENIIKDNSSQDQVGGKAVHFQVLDAFGLKTAPYFVLGIGYYKTALSQFLNEESTEDEAQKAGSAQLPDPA